ncbi:phosphate signaling complex PhoU family protein [Pyrobaculum neutrophilum]|uniref:Phosphate uptake regulator, PhoU n=1 Tax=Pyrobaculum neutrophilum (strain DSM 2338 / JCM 9278 / NBRC 100436 / V24Sta) TaxID=444157 RepID=B1Y8Y5_PYRNV|nr:phosphate uptake regulator PhoU [Pyrobaculum neutrophilum]ACB40214.1 phosphate uptake regulator, PhoU [Pyrobaculum neutrophilum V24Sta]
MELRRIIRVGERSFGVTLPKEWVESHGLTVGSPVKLLVDRDKITIFPSSEATAARRVRVGGEDVEKLTRDVIAYYIEGVDEIEVETGDISALVTKIEGKLPGVVLMEVGGLLRLKIVTREDVDIDEAVRSMYTTVDAMFALFLQMLSGGALKYAEEILRLDDQLDKLYFFSLRTVKRNIAQRPEHYVDYVITIKNLEHVGDAIDRATNYYLQNEMLCTAGVKTIFEKVYRYLQDSFNAFYNNDAGKALEVLLRRADLARETLQPPCPQATAVMHEAASIVGFAADIAEAAYSKASRR